MSTDQGGPKIMSRIAIVAAFLAVGLLIVLPMLIEGR